VTGADVVVIGGGLAGITAALDCADAGADVTLLERRRELGGATRSFRRGEAWLDNGQHVFLRCCTEYRALLDRLGVAHLVELQPRLDIPVLRPGRRPARLRRTGLPAPAHLAPALLGYRHLAVGDRVRAARAALALRSLDLDDTSLDGTTFGAWLDAQHQSPDAVRYLWDLICVPTLNLHAADASLALAAKVFRTGLFDDADAGDIGWSRVPLRTLHGDAARRALDEAGVAVAGETSVAAIRARDDGFEVDAPGRSWAVDAVVVATPHPVAARLLPPEAGIDAASLLRLGTSPIVDVHVMFDRRVTDLAFAAAVDSPAQFVFDRTAASGIQVGQCLAVSISAADAVIGNPPGALVAQCVDALRELFPEARDATVLDAVVTREHAATFRGVPGTRALRPGARTALRGLAVAGAWTDTGWPATMEGAVRSGHAAARAVLSALSGSYLEGKERVA
jgi:hydroxysqualene dehydroxylase